MRYILLFVLASCLLGGCSSSEEAATSDTPKTSIEVVNRGLYDMAIYVIGASQQQRLGTVSPGETQVLTIPTFFVNAPEPLRFVARPLGGSRAPVSQEIMVAPGDELRMVIPPS